MTGQNYTNSFDGMVTEANKQHLRSKMTELREEINNVITSREAESDDKIGKLDKHLYCDKEKFEMNFNS